MIKLIALICAPLFAAVIYSLNVDALWLWLGICLWSFCLYAIDKLCAIKGWQRVSEKMLLVSGAFASWPAAYFAQQSLRHKTQKQPFKRNFYLIAVLQTCIIASLGYFLFQSQSLNIPYISKWTN
ncbi:DUF1294 domain-containing protein [Shewanella sp. WXL01]|uniref:DUF1294 domain-containing protein n=1 Tax=Shewanella maritima TaxID=2520507 RepID=A0A411PEX3_9GAMM|nr:MULTISPECIES: DUF1294 domain-containing protein [Shewanella]NKF49830.1 DUF1294 domain-containing protein [Shewanella sp. WXL01]QBF82101.1 DUF1294 domain-containing protein [Shewanella maritima]